MKEKFLEIKDLDINYVTQDGVVEAVNKVNFTINRGETLGLVGETGAGKTTTALGILRLIPDPPGVINGGEIYFEDTDILKLTEAEMRKVRGNRVSMIFQDPMTSLNPVITVREQIAEVVEVHEGLSKQEAAKRANEMLELVGIPADRGNEYPHQFSGGMRQRVVIAIALAANPELLIADEPTTALDVTIQAQVLELMDELKREFNTSMLLITHDLGVVAEICETVAIIYAGEIVEYASLEDLFNNPSHPYTQGLFGSIPNLTEDVDRLNPIRGLMPDPTDLPSGCKFHPRCPYAEDICSKKEPEVIVMKDSTGSIEHQVKCFILSGEVASDRTGELYVNDEEGGEE